MIKFYIDMKDEDYIELFNKNIAKITKYYKKRNLKNFDKIIPNNKCLIYFVRLDKRGLSNNISYLSGVINKYKEDIADINENYKEMESCTNEDKFFNDKIFKLDKAYNCLARYCSTLFIIGLNELNGGKEFLGYEKEDEIINDIYNIFISAKNYYNETENNFYTKGYDCAEKSKTMKLNDLILLEKILNSKLKYNEIKNYVSLSSFFKENIIQVIYNKQAVLK